jgi:hypothetical protein
MAHAVAARELCGLDGGEFVHAGEAFYSLGGDIGRRLFAEDRVDERFPSLLWRFG